jgi:short-subunit dehydrogenase
VTGAGSRTCVVTGATGGIGGAFVLALAASGARVWALGRRQDALDALAERAGDGSVVPLAVDLESVDEIEDAAREVLARGDEVHLLVHSAGAITLGSIDAVSTESLDRMYAVNLRAAHALTQRLLPALRRGEGQVVFVNSSAAVRSSGANALYAASKAGLKALADGLRDDVNADGVRVTSVYAGRTATPMQEAVHAFEGRDYSPELLMAPEDIVTMVLAALELPPSAEVTDLHLRPLRKLPSA